MERLGTRDPAASELVKLVMFGGFSVEKAGQLLEMSRTNAFRHWAYARAWIKTHIAVAETNRQEDPFLSDSVRLPAADFALLGEDPSTKGNRMNRPPEKKDAKAIFSAAIEYYMPEQWEGYIVNACGDDEALRQRVRDLLDAHRQSDSFFDRKVGRPMVRRSPNGSGRRSAPTSCYKKSARADSASSTWPNSTSRSVAKWL